MPRPSTLAPLVVSAVLLLCGGARADALDSHVEKLLAAKGIPGAAIAVIHRGKVVKARGYGLASVEWETPVGRDTVFLLDAVTTTFTAVGVMMLVEQDKVSLDDSVRKYLRKAPAAWEPVTIRMLLAHTSGIKDDFWQEYRGAYLTDYTDADIDAFAFKQPLEFKPGERSKVAAIGYFLLGRVIERVTGETYPAWMIANVLKPSGMNQARFLDPREVVPRAASFYQSDGKTLVRSRGHLVTRRGTAVASYGLLASLEDLLAFDGALRGAKLIQQITLDRMWTAAVLNSGVRSVRGLGFEVGDQRGHRRVGQASGVGGVQYLVYPDDDLTVFWLSNLEAAGSPAGQLAGFAAAELTHPSLLPVQPDPDAAKTERLLQAERDVASGAKTSERLTPQFMASLAASGREEIAAAAKAKGPLQFVICDDVTRSRIQRHGVPVVEQCTYRIDGDPDTVDVLFSLAANGKLADLQVDPE